MTKILLSLAIVFSVTSAFADAGLNKRVSQFKTKAAQLIDQAEEKTIVATYDFDKHGGAVGTIGLGRYLPKDAVITRSWLHVDTAAVSGGTGTIAFQCEDANNIYTATYIGGSSTGALLEGASTGASSAFKTSIAAKCEISAVLAVEDFTAGKVSAYVRYFVHK